jgi:KRAB domain-containing zinc finger protein
MEHEEAAVDINSVSHVACDECAKSFAHDAGVVSHRRVHAHVEASKLTRCQICSSAFVRTGPASPADSPQRQRSMKMKGRYECEVCHATFSRSDRLLAHAATHTGAKPFRCDLCPQSFSRKDRLKTHRDLHFDNSQFVCGICSKPFTQRHHLKKHVKVSTSPLCNQSPISPHPAAQQHQAIRNGRGC